MQWKKRRYIYDIDEHEAILGARERTAQGKALRKEIPWSAHAAYELLDRDLVKLLAEQDEARIPELRGLRRERMLQSPFSFYRGAARLMAHDLPQGVNIGENAVVCGDAHLGNLGFFASPERRLVFDLNDFDEAAIGPWNGT